MHFYNYQFVWLLSIWNITNGSEKLNFKFYLMTISLNLNSTCGSGLPHCSVGIKVGLLHKWHWGTSLAVRWLGLSASTAGGTGSIPGRGTKIPRAVWHSQKIKIKQMASGTLTFHTERIQFSVCLTLRTHWIPGELKSDRNVKRQTIKLLEENRESMLRIVVKQMIS